MTAISLNTPLTAPTESQSREGPDLTLGGAAVLLTRDGRSARIEREGLVQDARIAFGCLVRPEPGDRVLVDVADGTVWVLSVLERPSGAAPCLWAEGDLSIVAVRGDISLMAGGAANIDAGGAARISAPEIGLHAGIARFVVDEFLQVGRKIAWHVAKIRSVGEILETFADHVLTRAKRGSRYIEETDQLRAGDIDHRAEGTLQLNARTAFVTADKVVRMDADQIHMG